jgi:hypothetical protein
MPDLRTDPDLDHLYWDSDLPVADLARRFGLPTRDVHRAVHPVDAGVTCYVCGASLSFTSRGARTSHRLRCPRCGATRRNPAHTGAIPPPRPSSVGGLIAIRDDGRDAGFDIETCVDALATHGLAWDGHSLVVLPARPSDGDDVLAALADHDVGVVAVTELTELAATQTGCLRALFELLRRRWHVVVGRDVPGAGYRRFAPADVDDVDERWTDNVIDLTCRWDRSRARW